MCLSVPFFIIPKVPPTIIGTVVVLRCYFFFQFLFSDLCIDLFYCILLFPTGETNLTSNQLLLTVIVIDIKLLHQLAQNVGLSKVGDRSRERPEGSLFDSYYTEV